MRRISGFIRVAAGAVGVAALAAHLVYSLGSGPTALPNFFSYFTMQSAIAATILWLTGGAIALSRPVDPAWLVTLRLLVTTNQIVSGVVYTVIVTESVSRGLSIQVPVSSQVLHYWLPAVALLDWLVSPGRPRPRWSTLLAVPVFPLVWAVFTMIRGDLVGWYPYFFLDPFQVTTPELLAYSGGVLAFILLVAAVLLGLGRVLPRPSWVAGSRRSGTEEGLEARPSAREHLGIVELRQGHGARTPD